MGGLRSTFGSNAGRFFFVVENGTTVNHAYNLVSTCSAIVGVSLLSGLFALCSTSEAGSTSLERERVNLLWIASVLTVFVFSSSGFSYFSFTGPMHAGTMTIFSLVLQHPAPLMI